MNEYIGMTDKGLHSKGSALFVKDPTDGLYHLLLPTMNMPAHRSAPETIAKTVLTDASVTNIQGLQSNETKTYNFHYHRSNTRRINEYVGNGVYEFLEVNADFTGEAFTGQLTYGRQEISVNDTVKGDLFIVVTSAEILPIDDVRALIKDTATLISTLNDCTIEVSGTNVQNVITNPSDATISATSSSTSVATVAVASNKITVTGVAKGHSIIEVTVSKTGYAPYKYTFSVSVL